MKYIIRLYCQEILYKSNHLQNSKGENFIMKGEIENGFGGIEGLNEGNDGGNKRDSGTSERGNIGSSGESVGKRTARRSKTASEGLGAGSDTDKSVNGKVNTNTDSRNSADSSGGNSETSRNLKEESKNILERPTLVKPKDVKPRKEVKKESKKDMGDITDPETLAVLIQSSFALLAGVTRRKHWEIEEEEAKTIANPASTMIQKLNAKQKQKINQLTAPILLGSAIASVVLPRVLIEMSMSRRVTNGQASQQKSSNGLQSTSQNNATVEGISNDGRSDLPKTASQTDNREIAELFGKLDNGTFAGTNNY